jgi:hypothetical protein
VLNCRLEKSPFHANPTPFQNLVFWERSERLTRRLQNQSLGELGLAVFLESPARSNASLPAICRRAPVRHASVRSVGRPTDRCALLQ